MGALVVLDDLHWADQPSLELLDVAARQIGGHRLLILGTYRDLEAPATLDRLAANADGITLGGLDTASVSGLVTTITGRSLAVRRRRSAAERRLLGTRSSCGSSRG